MFYCYICNQPRMSEEQAVADPAPICFQCARDENLLESEQEELDGENAASLYESDDDF